MTRNPERAAPSTRARVDMGQIVFFLSCLFLWSVVLEAPLRYALAHLHLYALIYVPKVLSLAAIILVPLLRRRVSWLALSLTALVGLCLLWGAANLPSGVQALFGLWVLVPFLFGLWAGPKIKVQKWRRLFVLLFLTTAAGVLLNPLFPYPWSGVNLSVLGKSIEVSRLWTAFGVQRYAGFARASFAAAVQLLLFSLMLVTLMRRRIAKVLVWLGAGIGIAATTSKGLLGAWLILSLYFLGGHALRWPRYWIRAWVGFLGLSLLLMILLPLSTLWVHYDPVLHGFTSRFLFFSFGARLNWMWPRSLHLLDLGGTWHWWVGRGLGGIGVAQRYFEPARFLSGDNLFVYVTVILGLPASLLLFAGLWWKAVRVGLRGGGAMDWRFPMLTALIVYGVVMNEIQGSLLAFFLGVTLAAHTVTVDQPVSVNQPERA